MPSTGIISFIGYILFIGFLSQTVSGDDPIGYICSATGASTIPYQAQTDMVLAALYESCPPTGFGGASVGTDPDLAQAYGLCRGDVSSSDCQACILEAGEQIRQLCPTSREGLVYYDNCFLVHTDVSSWGDIDDQSYICKVSGVKVSDPASFDKQVNYLLNQLAGDASGDPKLFSAGVMDLDGTNKLYGYVQCTGDLSGGDCKSCLESVIVQLPQRCTTDGNDGGRIVAGKCVVRFEMYPFINV